MGDGGLREAAERRRQRRLLQTWQAGTQFDMVDTQVPSVFFTPFSSQLPSPPPRARGVECSFVLLRVSVVTIPRYPCQSPIFSLPL